MPACITAVVFAVALANAVFNPGMAEPDRPFENAWATVQLGFIVSMGGGFVSLASVVGDFNARSGWRALGCVMVLALIGAAVFGSFVFGGS